MASLSTPELTETLDILTHPHRRYVLYCLADERGAVGIDSLAASVAERGERDTEREWGGSQDFETGLRHSHLPKLAAAGIITVDTDTDTVRLGNTEGVERFLAHTAPIDDSPQLAADD